MSISGCQDSLYEMFEPEEFEVLAVLNDIQEFIDSWIRVDKVKEKFSTYNKDVIALEAQCVFFCDTNDLISEKCFIVYQKYNIPFIHYDSWESKQKVVHFKIRKMKGNFSKDFDEILFCATQILESKPFFPDLDRALLQKFCANFEPKEQEVITIIVSASSPNVIEGSNFKTFLATTDMVILCDGTAFDSEIDLRWYDIYGFKGPSSNCREVLLKNDLHGQYGHLTLRKGQICRIKIREAKSGVTEYGSKRTFYMTEVLEENCKLPELQAYKDTDFDFQGFEELHDDFLGLLTYSPRSSELESVELYPVASILDTYDDNYIFSLYGIFEFCGVKIIIILESEDCFDTSTYIRARITARQMLRECYSWNKIIIDGAIKSILECFLDDIVEHTGEEIGDFERAAEEMKECLEIRCLSFDATGCFTAYLYYNFKGNSYVYFSGELNASVRCSISEGFISCDFNKNLDYKLDQENNPYVLR